MENGLVGQRISKARIKLGMSTQELAERIGKSQATVSRIENGKQGVTLPLLDKISKVLKIHLFYLLGTEGAPGAMLQRYGYFLQTILSAGRRKAHISLEVAAAESRISIERLEAFESGRMLPEQLELDALCILYSIDAELAHQVYVAEQRCPLLVSRLSSMNILLTDCLDLLRCSQQTAEPARLNGLTRRIENCLADLSCERQGDYFSIGHISNQLMKALQDPEFHAQAEEMARSWRNLNAGCSVDRPQLFMSEGDDQFMLNSDSLLTDSEDSAESNVLSSAPYCSERSEGSES